MPTYSWKEFLEQWNTELHEPEFRYEYYGGREFYEKDNEEDWDTFSQGKWLFGASEVEIAKAETRLGKKLPPSYREFLQITDGWALHSHLLLRLWPVSEIKPFEHAEWYVNEYLSEPDWLQKTDPKYVEQWQSMWSFPPEHFLATIEIGGFDGNDWYLLNPLKINENGEWEALIFGQYYDLERFSSFWEMMQFVYKDWFLGDWKKQ